jgi:hypothetical protein
MTIDQVRPFESWDDASLAAVAAIASVEDDYPTILTLPTTGDTLKHLRDVWEKFYDDHRNDERIEPFTPNDVIGRWLLLGGVALRYSQQIDRKGYGLNPVDVHRTLLRKQHDYGHENISRFGRIGLLIRTHDKIARLENLLNGENGKPNNESIEDTIMDIIGYSAIGIMWEMDTFRLDLK